MLQTPNAARCTCELFLLLTMNPHLPCKTPLAGSCPSAAPPLPLADVAQSISPLRDPLLYGQCTDAACPRMTKTYNKVRITLSLSQNPCLPCKTPSAGSFPVAPLP